MRCVNCGAEVEENTIFCPHCGHRARRRTAPTPVPIADDRVMPDSGAVGRSVPPESATPPRPTPGRAAPLRPTPARSAPVTTRPVYREAPSPYVVEEEPTEKRSAGCRWVMMTAMFTLVFLLVVLGLGALAVYQGLRDQSRESRELAQSHYLKGLDRMAEGSYDLAVAEFEMAVRLDPTLADAQARLTEARGRAAAVPTATVSSRRELVEQLYRDARGAYDRREWEAAIAKLEELRVLDPSYQEAEVKSLLFYSYYNHGLVLVNETRVQEAMRRFDQALELQPNHPDVLGQRHLASLYSVGLSYWSANWARAVENFDALYRIQPSYLDVRQRLHDAHLAYGEQLAGQGSWCEARDQYTAALNIIVTQDVANRRDQAARQCEAGPSQPPAAGTPAPPGTFVGYFRGYLDVRNTQTSWVGISGRVVDANGKGVPGVAVRVSAFDWSAIATTDGEGAFGIGPLTHEITYTLTLVDLPVQPIDIAGKFGMIAQVDFVEKR